MSAPFTPEQEARIREIARESPFGAVPEDRLVELIRRAIREEQRAVREKIWGVGHVMVGGADS